MNGLPWFKCFPRDFNEGMIGLSLEERGAYITVLNLIYQRGGPVPDDAPYFRALLSCTPKTWAKIRAALIARGKLFEVNFNGADSLMNRRAADELARREEISEIRSELGERGGRKTQAKRRENNDLAQANAEQAPSKVQAIQITEVRQEDANASLSADADAKAPTKYPEPFEAAWKAYPHVKGRSGKSKAFAVWRRLTVPVRTALPLAAARYAREGRDAKGEYGAPAMERWLNDGKWEDWIAPAKPTVTTPLTPELEASRLSHYRQTGEWKDHWGSKPERTAA